MKVSLYAVFDRCSGVYDGPIPGRADAEMIRNFTHMAIGGESPIAKSPEDFTLFKVGAWNDGTGELEDFVPEKLINGAEALSNSRVVDNGDN
jgi:hypothetical protein